MSDLDVRQKRFQKLRDPRSKVRHDQADLRGAFAVKVIDPRKGTYKRNKLRVNNIKDIEDIDGTEFDDN